MTFTVRDLGLQDYHKTWELQRELLAQRAQDLIPDQLILVEHPAVYTTGRAFQPEHLTPEAQAPVIAVERGGSITFHEPGQLVGYPIFKLTENRRDIHGFLRGMENALIQTLKELGYTGAPDARNTGVWINGKKVAAMGIAVRRWVTWHGFALNVNNPLNLPQYISPCGFEPELVTSLARENTTGNRLAMEEVKGHCVQAFKAWWDESHRR